MTNLKVHHILYHHPYTTLKIITVIVIVISLVFEYDQLGQFVADGFSNFPHGICLGYSMQLYINIALYKH